LYTAYRLDGVMTVVSFHYYLVAQTGLGLSCEYFARAFRKGGDYAMPSNIATAAMEDIYERLCWLYT
jgi:hypothetical protein